ncbi:MAG: hypothetical protein JOZ41_00605 [Chloroflexi bacterium]|nr:hypothetical protein [Chloroflexota bacterium]
MRCRRLPVSIAAPIGIRYIVATVVLAVIFLHDAVTILKVVGLFLAIGGVVLLAHHAR